MFKRSTAVAEPPAGYQQVTPTQPKRKRRVFTWVILAVNALFLVWVIYGAVAGSGTVHNCGALTQQTCNSAGHAGTAIGVVLVLALWAVVDVILGVLWLVTRRREPQVVYVQK